MHDKMECQSNEGALAFFAPGTKHKKHIYERLSGMIQCMCMTKKNY